MKDGVASNCDSTKASLESVQDSLSSLTSQFSRLEARLCSSPDPIGTRNATQVSPSSAQISGQFFGCGAVRSIDDAIVKGRCIYCSKDVSSYSSDEVGRHLADNHSFGCCNPEFWHSSWGLLRIHLNTAHGCDVRIGDDAAISTFFSHTPSFGDTRNLVDQYINTVESSSTWDEELVRSQSLASCYAAFVPLFDDTEEELRLLANFINGKEVFATEEVLTGLITTRKFDKLLAVLWHSRVRFASFAEQMTICGMSPRSLPMDGHEDIGKLLLQLGNLLEQINILPRLANVFASWPEPHCKPHSLTARVNNWLMHVLHYSSNTRSILAQQHCSIPLHFGQHLQWLTLVGQFWLQDGVIETEVEDHLLSDGAINSKDASLEHTSFTNAGSEHIPDFTPWNPNFTRTPSSAGSASSISSILSYQRGHVNATADYFGATQPSPVFNRPSPTTNVKLYSTATHESQRADFLRSLDTRHRTHKRL